MAVGCLLLPFRCTSLDFIENPSAHGLAKGTRGCEYQQVQNRKQSTRIFGRLDVLDAAPFHGLAKVISEEWGEEWGNERNPAFGFARQEHKHRNVPKGLRSNRSCSLCGTLSKLTVGEIGIETPVGKAIGVPMPKDIMVVPIMRAGLPLLPAFTQVLPDIPVGITGIERDENTALPRAYYKKFPKDLPERAVILDPMLATGGSACLAVDFPSRCRL